MRSHHALEQLWPRHAEGRIVRTCRYAGRVRRGEVSSRIAKVAIGGLKLADKMRVSEVIRIGDCNAISFVRYHEYAAVGTVLGA